MSTNPIYGPPVCEGEEDGSRHGRDTQGNESISEYLNRRTPVGFTVTFTSGDLEDQITALGDFVHIPDRWMGQILVRSGIRYLIADLFADCDDPFEMTNDLADTVEDLIKHKRSRYYAS